MGSDLSSHLVPPYCEIMHKFSVHRSQLKKGKTRWTHPTFFFTAFSSSHPNRPNRTSIFACLRKKLCGWKWREKFCPPLFDNKMSFRQKTILGNPFRVYYFVPFSSPNRANFTNIHKCAHFEILFIFTAQMNADKSALVREKTPPGKIWGFSIIW